MEEADFRDLEEAGLVDILVVAMVDSLVVGAVDTMEVIQEEDMVDFPVEVMEDILEVVGLEVGLATNTKIRNIYEECSWWMDFLFPCM